MEGKHIKKKLIIAAIVVAAGALIATLLLTRGVSGKYYDVSDNSSYIEFQSGGSARIVSFENGASHSADASYTQSGATVTLSDGRAFTVSRFSRDLSVGGAVQFRKTPLFDVLLVFTRIPPVLEYLPITMEIAVISMLFSLLLAFAVAIVKVRNIPVLRTIAAAYVSFTRGTPVLIQLYATYFGIPMLLKALNVNTGFINGIPPIVFSLIALAMNDAAYSSEAIRAAIQAVDKGQIEAAHSIGMSNRQTLLRIIIPESLVIALPSLGNAFIGMIKGTSLVFTTAVVEMTARGRQLSQFDYRYFEMYVTLAIIYWVITFVVSKLLNAWERHLKCNERTEKGGSADAEAIKLAQKL